MKKFRIYAYNDQDDKLEVYCTDSIEQAVSVACALYSASELELKILNSNGESLVSFIKPHLRG